MSFARIAEHVAMLILNLDDLVQHLAFCFIEEQIERVASRVQLALGFIMARRVFGELVSGATTSRLTIISELGRVESKDAMMRLAIEICRIKPATQREGVKIVRDWRCRGGANAKNRWNSPAESAIQFATS